MSFALINSVSTKTKHFLKSCHKNTDHRDDNNDGDLHITHAGGYLNDCHVVLLVCKYLMLFCHETTDWHVIQSGIPRCYPSGLSLIGRLLGILASDWMTIVNLVSIENMNLTWQWHCTCAPGHLFVYYCISNKNLLLFFILHFVLELVNFSFLMSKKFYLIARELNPFSKV